MGRGVTGVLTVGSAAVAAQLIVAGDVDGAVGASSGGRDGPAAVDVPMSCAALWTTNDAAGRREHS